MFYQLRMKDNVVKKLSKKLTVLYSIANFQALLCHKAFRKACKETCAYRERLWQLKQASKPVSKISFVSVRRCYRHHKRLWQNLV